MRNTRQEAAFPKQLRDTLNVAVAGVGAVGHQVARMLGAMGPKSLLFVDPDTVSMENLGPQLWEYAAAINNVPKVRAVGDAVAAMNPGLEIVYSPDRFASRHAKGMQVLFNCVDSLQGRLNIARIAEENGCQFMVDSRVSGDTIEIHTVAPDQMGVDCWRRYRNTLTEGPPAYEGTCTSRMFVHAAFVAAGLLVSQFSLWMRGSLVEPRIDVGLAGPILTTKR